MSHRYSVSSPQEAEAAAALLAAQGFQVRAERTEAETLVILEQDSVEAVELLLRRAPSAKPAR